MRGLIFLTVMLFASRAFAGYMPENSLFIPADERAEFHKVLHAEVKAAIKAVTLAYADDVAKLGAKLVIHDKWSDGTVNAYAYRNDPTVWEVDFMGGLARYGRMDKYAVMGVLCHEVGHHLGGQPTYNNGSDWAAVEGQADYWGYQDCIGKVAPGYELRSARVLSETLASLEGSPKPSIKTPDKSVVTETFEEHPLAQCRLDTMYNAIKKRARPRCWYAPKKGELNDRESEGAVPEV